MDKIEVINTEKHQMLRTAFFNETGIYALLDNTSYMNWLETKLVKNLELNAVSCQREQLPKRFSNEAYKKAQVMHYEGFVEWWDEQL